MLFRSSNGQPITREHLPSMAINLQPISARQTVHATPGQPASVAAASALHAAADNAQGDNAPCPVKLNPIQANERQVLLQMLEQHRWNVSNVAKALDVSRNTLYRKLHKLNIQISHPEPAG